MSSYNLHHSIFLETQCDDSASAVSPLCFYSFFQMKTVLMFQDNVFERHYTTVFEISREELPHVNHGSSSH